MVIESVKLQNLWKIRCKVSHLKDKMYILPQIYCIQSRNVFLVQDYYLRNLTIQSVEIVNWKLDLKQPGEDIGGLATDNEESWV